MKCKYCYIKFFKIILKSLSTVNKYVLIQYFTNSTLTDTCLYKLFDYFCLKTDSLKFVHFPATHPVSNVIFLNKKKTKLTLLVYAIKNHLSRGINVETINIVG